MTVSTMAAAPVEITRRRLAALLATTTAAASALTWALTIAIDTTAERRTITATWQGGAPGNTLGDPYAAATGPTVAAESPPIVVADAYHGVGIAVCADGSAPINIADAYHGVGTTLCP